LAATTTADDDTNNDKDKDNGQPAKAGQDKQSDF